MVVRTAWKHEFTSEKLEQGTSCCPYIDLRVIRCTTENDFGCSIERRDEDICYRFWYFLWCEARAKVTKLDAAGVLRDHYVVWFQICMNETIAMEQAQGYKQLTAIENDAIKAQADVATEPIKSLAKVHVHTFVN